MVNYAPFSTRLLAHNLDLLVLLIPAYGLSYLIPDDLILYITLFIIYILYNSILEAGDWQGTLGKKAVNIQVTGTVNNEKSLKRSLIRNLMKFLSLSLLFSGFIMISFNRKNQALHDKISGSVVIFSREKEKVLDS